MIDYKEIQPKLDGLWQDVLAMYGIHVGDFKGLNTKNTSCPCCGGDDRAHWRQQYGRIALYCRHCTDGSMKSPEDVILELTNITFHELVNNLADFVNHVPLETIKKASVRSKAQPKQNMPIDHKQDHQLVERFLSQCEWCHSIRLLSLNAPNPQKLPVKNEIDYWLMYNKEGIAVNLVKYEDDEPKFLAGGISYGCLYTIKGGKRVIIVTDPIDGILCWYKTKATILVAFTEANLRYTLAVHGNDINPVVCTRKPELVDEFADSFGVRLLSGDSYGKKDTVNEFKINVVN